MRTRPALHDDEAEAEAENLGLIGFEDLISLHYRVPDLKS